VDSFARVRAVTGRVVVAAVAACLAAACWRTGDPTPSDALVTWAAYPDTVRVGETFSFEFGGPIAPTACGRLDTATLAVTDTAIVLAARRSTFSAVCAPQRISFYEARPVELPAAGTYPVRTPGGTDLGAIVATDSGSFSVLKTIGEGTVREAAGCWLFGPGWVGSQRVFALSGVSTALLESAGTDRIVGLRGRIRGFSSCGNWGSRPRIRVDTAWVTDRTVDDWYGDADDASAQEEDGAI
jgi:hypothetical protein